MFVRLALTKEFVRFGNGGEWYWGIGSLSIWIGVGIGMVLLRCVEVGIAQVGCGKVGFVVQVQ